MPLDLQVAIVQVDDQIVSVHELRFAPALIEEQTVESFGLERELDYLLGFTGRKVAAGRVNCQVTALRVVEIGPPPIFDRLDYVA